MSATGEAPRYASVAVPVPLRRLFAYAVGERPGPLERVYGERTKKVWKRVIGVLEKEGLEIPVADREAGLIQTDMKVFDEV